MERSIFWIMMDSRLRGNDKEDAGMTEREHEWHKCAIRYIDFEF